jgi:hypothetical protein
VITYTFKFEEKPDGSFVVTYKSPPGHATEKEIAFAKNFIGHNRDIFSKLAKLMAGKLSFVEDN